MRPVRYGKRKVPNRKSPIITERAVPAFYHSRNCTQCTTAEVDGDSDNETDWPEWEVRLT